MEGENCPEDIILGQRLKSPLDLAIKITTISSSVVGKIELVVKMKAEWKLRR